MRFSNMCPKCGRQKFAVTKELRQPDHHSSNVTEPMAVVTIQDGILHRKAMGIFEAWICLHCGFTELYAHDLPYDIEETIKKFPEQWRIVDATPPDHGPYR